MNGAMQRGTFGVCLCCLLIVYAAVVLLIGWISRLPSSTANQYLNGSSSLPTWAVAVSFFAYNCGSIEILGMSAMAAQYGVQALHFYWIGGIPGMVLMALVVLPIYMRTGARSLPEYLDKRFGGSVRLISAALSALSTAAFAGVTLYGLAHVLHVIAGWTLLSGTLVFASVVLAYVLLGGVRATIYTSVFQICLLIGGLAPLLFFTVHFTPASFAARTARWHLWRTLPVLSPQATLDQFGVVFGLGLVISLSYWCTDFVMIQRALTAKSVEAARRVPLLAGFGKMLVAFLVVLPAVVSPSLFHGTKPTPFDEVLPRLLSHFYSPALLAFGAAALLAGLMSGMAGNLSGFAAVCTEEIYRIRLNLGKDERHYLFVGRLSVLACVLLALLGDYAAFRFSDLMEFLQLILALSYAPVFAVVLVGATTQRIQARAAGSGILVGVLSGLILQAAFWVGFLHFGSQMTANFYTALVAFSVTLLSCHISQQFLKQEVYAKKQEGLLRSDVLSAMRPSAMLIALSILLLSCCICLNIVWR